MLVTVGEAEPCRARGRTRLDPESTAGDTFGDLRGYGPFDDLVLEYVCTREAGHEGLHIACGNEEGHAQHCWEEE